MATRDRGTFRVGVADPGAMVVRAGVERTMLSQDPVATPGVVSR